MGETSALQARITTEPRGYVAEAFRFLQDHHSAPVLPLEDLRHSLVSLFTARGSGGDLDSKILATLGVFRPPVRCIQAGVGPGKFDLFVIDAVKVSPILEGFDPNVLRMLISSAVAELAWAHASDDERSACLLVLTTSSDFTLNGELIRLAAKRVRSPPNWLSLLLERSALDSVEDEIQIWCLDAYCAARAIAPISQQPAWCVGVRHILSPGPRRLSLSIDFGWLQLARDHLRDIASGAYQLPWAAPPASGLVSVEGGLSRRSAHGI